MITLNQSRIGTDSTKWDGLNQFFGSPDLIPMWVADMDFAVSPAIQNALSTRLEHPNFGPSEVTPTMTLF